MSQLLKHKDYKLTVRETVKKMARMLLYILCFVLFIIIAITIFLNTNYGKKIVKNKAQAYLQDRIKTKFVIGSIDYSFPKSVEIKNLYIEDLQKDTLLYGERLAVDLDMIKLIWGDIYISKVELKNIKANIARTANDSSYNYQFLIDAFASKKGDIKKTDTTAATTIAIKQLLLNGVSLSFIDKYAGNNFSTSINHLDITVDKFQPDKLLFAIDKFKTDGINFSMQTYITAHSSDSIKHNTTKNNSLQFSVNEFELANVNFRFDNNKSPRQKEGFDALHINAKNIKANAKNIFYTADSTTVNVNQFALSEQCGFTIDTTHAKIFYSKKGITATELYIKTPQSILQNSLQLHYNDIATILTNPKNTTLAATLKNTTIAVNDIYTLIPFVKKYLPVDKFQNNFIKINTTVNGNLEQLNIPLLQVQGLSGSTVNAKAVLYNVSDSLKLAYDITVFNTHILKNDLLKFIPNNNYVGELPADLSLSTHVKGNNQNSIIDINANSNVFKFNGKADVKSIDNPSTLKYNISIADARVEKSFITKFIPANSIPPTVKLPQTILFKGSLKGDMNNVQSDLIINGTYGMVTAKGYVNNLKNKDAAKYDIHFTTKDFAIGKLLSQDSVLGNVTLSATAKGTGFDYKKMRSAFDVKIQNAFIKNYNYSNVNLKAALEAGNISSFGSINDASLQMQYTAAANLSGEYPAAVEAIIKMDTLQLQQLHLYKDTLNTSFKMFVTANDLNPRNLNLNVLIDSSKLTVKNKNYLLDSITVRALSASGKNDITLKSPLADIVAVGSFDYDKISPSLLQYIDKYYDVISTSNQNLPAQQIAINGVIKKHPLITDLVQGLTYESIHFDGKYNSQGGDSTLNFHSSLPKFSYQSYVIDSGKINVNSFNNKIDYSVDFNKLQYNTNTLYASSVKGDIINDSVHIVALTKDAKYKDRYKIDAALTAKEKNYTISLKNDLLINYDQWNVSPTNKISYSPQGILVKNFFIENGKTKIAANSKEEISNSPIDIDIVNFDIKDIASIANSDTLMASGIINGKVTVSSFEKKLPAFIGNISIDSFFFQQQPVGNIKFTAKNETENTINANMEITGYGNLATVKGNYYLNNEANQFDADLSIERLRMSTAQAFTAGNLTNSSGNINGKIQLSGNFKEPKWNGNINFDTAKFTVAQTGVPYSINQQKISLAYPVISFNKFVIEDTANHKLSIDGDITAQSISAYDLSLAIHSNDFILVNTPKKSSSTVYGFAAADADINVNGSTTSPDIEGNITLNNKSDVAIILPEQNINKDAAKSVVRFIDRDSFELPEKVLFTPALEEKQGVAQFINYNLNISINKNSALTIIIDPASGDELKVQGDAQLNAGVDPGGHIVLAGNYALKSGYYVLNYQFLKKKFNLLEGSTIAFSGSPMDAQVDITAEYIANASPGDLLENEIGQMDSKMANTFNQKIPFRVLLYLKGDLKKPVISFDIQLPDESANLPISNEMRTTIENKLTQVRADATVTNKEIFSLLLLGHFVGEQSTDFFKAGGGGSGVDNIARESVSKFLSSALNEIASDLIKGIDVDLNLKSYQDFSTGDAQQKTDLNVAITKSFLDNRLSITAGKNFGVEGQDAAAKTVQQNNNSIPDITLNYKLSKDGKYALRAYRKDQFEVTVDGYVIETGLAFIVTYDYDKFKEFFKKKEKNKSNKTTTKNE